MPTSDVISGVALNYVGMDIRARFGDSRLNNGRIIRLFGWQDSFFYLRTFVQYLVVFGSRSEAASDWRHFRQMCGAGSPRLAFENIVILA